MKLLNDAQVLKNVLNVGPFYQKLVKEFIMNLPKGFNNTSSSEYKKVHVMGH